MIIIIGKSKINDDAANALYGKNGETEKSQYYPNIDLRNTKDEQLTIIDLRATSEFQELFSPELFARQLITYGMPENIQTINLVVSDMNPQKSLFTFAQNFSVAVKKNSLQVYIPADLNYITFVSPPSDNNTKWQVYGIKVADYQKDFAKIKFNIATKDLEQKQEDTSPSYDLFKGYKNKILLWEGDDFLAWLNNNERKIPGKPSMSFF